MSTSGLGFDISMAFQPIVERGTGVVFAQEALVRGPSGEPAATVFEQVTSDNLYLFDQTCRTTAIATAAAQQLDALLSINFMPNAVYTPGRCLGSTIVAARAARFPLDRIIFEIVESEDITDVDHLRDIVDTYRSYGMRTALDDVGARFAGLRRMTDLQTDIIKIDRYLVSDLDRDRRKRAIVSGLINIAHELGCLVVAEGIERRQELITALALGTDLAQGFFIARPEIGAWASLNPDAIEILQSSDQLTAATDRS